VIDTQEQNFLSSSEVIDVFGDRDSMFLLKAGAIAPIRQDRSGITYALVSGKGRRLYVMAGRKLAIFENEAAVDPDSLIIPKNFVDRRALPSLFNALLSDSNLSDTAVNLAVEANQFGVYCYFAGNELLLLHLVDYAESKSSAVLVSWEEGEFTFDGSQFNARLKFSPFANASAILGQLTQMLNRLTLSDLIEMRPEQSTITSQPEYEAPAPEKDQIILPVKPDVEMVNSVFEITSIPSSSSVSSKKVGSEEKCLRAVLCYGFPNLAVHPESVTNLIGRYSNLRSLMSVLRRLASQENVSGKKIQGRAGKFGWREVAEHLSTGKDKRGRVYYRSVEGKPHLLDVYISWKKDEKDQEKTLNMLANLSTFDNPDVIMG
jgi:hypothetical protein